MMTNLKRKAFTLVELLTVVAIMSILIGILVPAVNRARSTAAKAAAKAQLHGIGQGVEMFKTDFGYYPSSLPQNTNGVDAAANRTGATVAATPVEGAHRLAMAMLGRDQLGCPAKRGPAGTAHGLPNANSNPGPDSFMGYYYSATPNGALSGANLDYLGVGDTDWGHPDYKTARKGPYIDPKGFNIVKDESFAIDSGDDFVRVLSDRYDKRGTEEITEEADYESHSVILYYAANERGKYLYRGTASTDYLVNDPDNIYYYQDNQRIATGGSTNTQFKDGYNAANFCDYLDDDKAVIGTTHRPVNPESFLLISKGEDGIYGTDDDITNWTN
jgi:prepilin-type N-terminal cleavage/methylation domain-containing protein